MPEKEIRLRRSIGFGVHNPKEDLIVTVESFDYTGQQRWRPKKIEGLVWKRDGAREADDLDSLPCRHPDGQFDERPAPFGDAGHLVASVLSGTNDPENLVPVSKQFNDQMRVIENSIRLELDEDEQRMLTVTVPSYFDVDPRIPAKVVYNLASRPPAEDEDSDEEFFRTRADAKRKKVRTIFPAPITQSYLVVADSGKRHTGFQAHMAMLQLEMDRTGWVVEDFCKSRGLAELAASVEGVPRERRPYAVLDYFFLVKGGVGYASVKGTYRYAALAREYAPGLDCEFLPWQQALMLKLNYARHGGYVRSDAHGVAAKPNTGIPIVEKHQSLIFGASGNGPAYDHIRPLKKRGSNLFSNAQIVSGSFNSRKSSQF